MGWFLVNIMLPVFLPVVGILPLWLLPQGALSAKVQVIMTVKDGQLCWAVIAMGASTIYELWQTIEANKPHPAWAGFALVGVFLTMLPAMVIAAAGTVFSTPPLTASGVGLKAWVSHYKMFVGSAVMTAIAAFAYTMMHMSLPSCG